MRGMTLRRPVKVERTRKRSEGFPPDRKVEKKKGKARLPWSRSEAPEVVGREGPKQLAPVPGVVLGQVLGRGGGQASQSP